MALFEFLDDDVVMFMDHVIYTARINTIFWFVVKIKSIRFFVDITRPVDCDFFTVRPARIWSIRWQQAKPQQGGL